MNVKQNPTEYQLTEKEKILLEVLVNPDYRMKSVTDICKIAKCSRSTYYEAFSKPGFVEIYKQQSMDLVKQSVASVLNTFIREAQRGSFQHGKVILEMAGIYTEKQQTEVTGKDGGPIEIADARQKLIEKLTKDKE